MIMKPHIHTAPRRQRGLTIVELMVAALISLILLAGIVQIFIANRQTYRLHEALSRVQENGRFATEFLSLDVRQAGYMGCFNPNNGDFYNMVKTDHPSKLNPDTGAFANFDGSGALDGRDNVSDPLDTELTNMGLALTADLSSGSTGDVLAGTDLIILRGGGTCEGGEVLYTGEGETFRYKDTANIKIKDAAACGLDQNSVVMVTDCATADMFAITNQPISGGPDKDTLAHGAANNISVKLQGSYGPGSEILTLKGSVIYIGKGASGEPALFRRELNTTTTGFNVEELVEGVENMQITYGEDTDSDNVPNHFVAAGSVTNMERVVALRLSLLIRSQDNATDTNQTYTYNGATVTAGDLRLRRVFNTTIMLRNRMI